MSELLFVYGTLRPGSGHPRARRLRAECEPVGRGSVGGRLLAVAGYPGLVPGKGRVLGDVVRLARPAATLPWVDAYEGPEFRRQRCTVRLDGGATARAWCYRYVGPTEGLESIASGDFLHPG